MTASPAPDPSDDGKKGDPPNATSLAGLVKFVPFVLTLGSGFLKIVVPPTHDKVPLGFATFMSILALAAFLVARKLLRRGRSAGKARQIELYISLPLLISAIAGVAVYVHLLGAHTAESPAGVQEIIGSELQPRLQSFVGHHPELTPSALLFKFGSPEKIWTLESLRGARELLLYVYAAVLLLASIGLSLLCDFEDKKQKG
jgi:hypothetical protein